MRLRPGWLSAQVRKVQMGKVPSLFLVSFKVLKGSEMDGEDQVAKWESCIVRLVFPVGRCSSSQKITVDTGDAA